MGVDEKCPRCGNSLQHVGKSVKTAQGHHARKFKCNNNSCPKESILGGWANQ